MKLSLKKRLRRLGLHILYTALTPVVYENIRFVYSHRYLPHLRHPRSFSEHVVHRKLYAPVANSAQLADKNAVRDYVRERMGNEDLLNKVYWVGADLGKLEWNSLPQGFVAKRTSGSGEDFIKIVRNKDTLGERAFREWAEEILKLEFGHTSNEHFYKQIKPQMLIEELMVDKTYTTPLDYKFYVFHGRVEYIHVDQGRFVDHHRTVYDRNWQQAPFGIKKPIGAPVARPAKLNEMIAIVEKLAAGTEFLRIDLYLLNEEKIIFGEITMAPVAGQERFYPDKKYDFEMGKLWSRA